MSLRRRALAGVLIGLTAATLVTAPQASASPIGDEVEIAVAFQVSERVDVIVGSGVEYSYTTGERGGSIVVDVGDGTLVISQSGFPSRVLSVTVSDLDWLESGEPVPGAIDGFECATTLGTVVVNQASFTEDSLTVTTAPTPQSAFRIECTYTVRHEPVTPEGIIDDLIEQIRAFVDARTLDPGNGNALIQKLEGAQANLTSGAINGACGKLGAFVNQVEAFVNTATLPADPEGQSLLDGAAAAQQLLDC